MLALGGKKDSSLLTFLLAIPPLGGYNINVILWK